jgi:polar amino acid transport system substrate-binding protein
MTTLQSVLRRTVRTRLAPAAVLAVLTLTAACHQASTTGPSSNPIIIASGHPEWPPIMFRSGGTIDGAGPALVKKILAAIDGAPTSVYTDNGTWDTVLANTKAGSIDLLVGAYKTTERQGWAVFSDPYTTDPVALFVAKGRAFPFTTFDNLVGKRGVGTVGDSYGQAFDDFAAARLDLRRAETVAEAFALVSSGQADYMVYSLYSGGDYLKKAGAASQFETLPKFISEENFYIAVSKQSRYVGLLPRINQEIARRKADGTITALIAQYSK